MLDAVLNGASGCTLLERSLMDRFSLLRVASLQVAEPFDLAFEPIPEPFTPRRWFRRVVGSAIGHRLVL